MDTPCVRFDEVEIVYLQPNGGVEKLAWAGLQAVWIETNADGPFEPDLFWLLVGQSGLCRVAAGADGEPELLERLQKLPGFDNEAVIAAMSCVVEQRFLCWQRG